MYEAVILISSVKTSDRGELLQAFIVQSQLEACATSKSHCNTLDKPLHFADNIKIIHPEYHPKGQIILKRQTLKPTGVK